jgi:hypothetical protein
MLDPFPVKVPKLAADATKGLADYLSLPTLPLHIHEVLGAAFFYYWVQTRLSPWLSPKLSPKHYPNLTPRTRLNWDVHVVSFVQSVLVCAIAAYVAVYDDERRNMNWEERVWGYTGGTGLVEAMGLGYFLYDLWITAQNVSMFGIGMLFHAISALTVFSFGFVCALTAALICFSMMRLTTHPETIRKLLLPRLHLLRALLPFPERPLVL